MRVQRVCSTLLITIDRPQARNAVNAAVAAALAAALDELEADSALRAGVLTGAKGTFSVGKDLKTTDLKTALNGESPTIPGRGFGGPDGAGRTKPLIAAVEGVALGGGLELALACDLIVAAEDATFGLPDVERGPIAVGGGVTRLPERVPYHLAMEFLLTGGPVSGARAERLGLVNRVTGPGEAVAVALGLAEQLARNAPLALAAVRNLVRAADGVPEADLFAVQREELGILMASADAREGMTAFAERRAPRWTGK
ncbi:crotonase/enoyl-CoA hydratase family protein [Streptomyces sp. NPDC005195]|uniref:crotonase/enoyl-CoA hydratase family protein n=1 Tax=Streptomyces sp. NPDC005195 TaxID=3154561 RepID=UPI0033AC86CF